MQAGLRAVPVVIGVLALSMLVSCGEDQTFRVMPEDNRSAVSYAQEGSDSKRQQERMPERQATVTATGGSRTRIESVQIEVAELGVMSVTRVTTIDFRFLIGEAEVTIPLSRIRIIEFKDDCVVITGFDGRTVKGCLHPRDDYSVKGVSQGENYEWKLVHLQTVEFTPISHKLKQCPKCSRTFTDLSWEKCPMDRTLLVDSE
ncbi:MAG: hypothetical protein ACYTFG_12675 [Planctomycetota bacterium]|jgi:hypothetical protein